ncbi:MAG TPA: cation/multidrug efflux pump [Oceanospirillales bacterium]|nr:cation/multidrug efflux pump [Oleispira sp.]HCM06328.1 cation/multidrug efflux pump [Oceanospirillales bacterium]|tara:strand:- start:1091 stop:1732 length:642 start_codon:yes stop_codon:yes gene_type:complete
MLQGSFVFVLVVVGLLLLLFSSYLLFKRGWFIAWLKGSFAIALVVGAVFSLLSLFDVLSYKQLMSEVPIATISIYEKGDQYYDVTLVDSDSVEHRFEIHGDQWQLDARLLTWVGPLAAVGQKPLYRLDRISGRYVSLEQARNGEQSVFSLEHSEYVDLWQLFDRFDTWIDVSYGSAVYMPMENGAVFSVHLTAKGMNVRPINSIAKKVLKEEW